ncbi:hypothetical protein MBLNU457_7174t1 [Dothideomycetes sp. NU457]
MDEGGPSGLFVGDEPSQDSDDNISLTSTVPEEEQVFYHVEEILCEGERELDGAPMWLVKWSGYPLTQATFEPRENFTSSSTIEEWEIKRKAIDGGKEPAFDLDQWVQDVEAEKRATAERKRKRQEKRRALQANAAGLRKRPSSSNRTPRKGLATKRIRKESDEPSDDLGPAERRRKLTNTSSALPAISENNDDGNTSSNKVREPARQVTVIDPPPRPSSATAKATERSVAANPVSSNQSIGTSGPSTGPSQRPAPMAPMRRPASASSNYTMFGGKAPTTATAKRSSNSASTNQKVTVMTNDPSARRKSATRTAGPGASTGYRNLQHQHRARKRNQEEQAPNFDDLRTFNPGERRTAVNRLPAESDAGNLATDSAQGTVTPNTVIANTVIPSTVTPNPATASTTKEPSARNTPPTDTISKPPPMPLTTSSTGAIASTSAAKGPLIRKRSNSQLNVGNLSLNATESRSTAMAQDAIESGDTFPTRAPMATMVSSTRSTQTQGGPALEPSQPKTQLTMTQHVEAQPSGVQLRVDTPGDGIPDGFMDIDDIDDDEPGLFHDTSTSTPGVVSTTQSIPLPQPADEPSLPPAQPSLPSEPSRSLSLPLPASHTPRVPTSGSDEEVFMNEMIVKLCEAQLQLKSERLFTGSKGMVFDKVVCLMFPPSQVAEITLITRYLQAIGATVVNPEIPGSWRAYIRKIRDMSKSGVILYHPSIFNYHQMYNFRHTLLNGYINHFQLGIDAALQDHPQAKTVYSCIRLFPHGDLVLLPDDLLFHEPAKALQIVQAFYANLKLKPIGGRNARLVFRPGVREVLAKLKLREDEQATRIELWRTIEEMYKKFERMKFPGSMQPKHVNIVSQPIQFAPKYAALWEEDQAKATNWLVDWFAGWCLSQRERFRRFHIIASDDKGETANRWLRHYQHVVVSSPEKYLLRYKKR